MLNGASPIHMELTQPIVFEPLFMERVWGGRGWKPSRKRFPPGERIGESWEIVDREAAQSVVHEGSLQGDTLHELWVKHREEIFGRGLPDSAALPAAFQDTRRSGAAFIAGAPSGGSGCAARRRAENRDVVCARYLLEADIYAGLKHGVTREEFLSARA